MPGLPDVPFILKPSLNSFTVPLAIAAPAALAGLSYINAKTSLSYDWRLLGSAVSAQVRGAIREKKDRLSTFYLLESHALGKQANHPLLIFEGRSWTYKQVYETALKYGQWLKTVHSIKPKEIVAMDFMNGDKFIFIWLGLWAIGAKPAFINYNLSGKALAHCIRVAKANLVLVDPQVSENVSQEVQDELSDIRFEVFTPEIEARIATMEAKREPDEARSDPKIQNMAIVIFTSGTTGLPKGAIVSWSKIIVGSGLAPGWMSFTKKDVFYTVSLPFLLYPHLVISPRYSHNTRACRSTIPPPPSSASAPPSQQVQPSLSERNSAPKPSGAKSAPHTQPQSNTSAKPAAIFSRPLLKLTPQPGKT